MWMRISVGNKVGVMLGWVVVLAVAGCSESADRSTEVEAAIDLAAQAEDQVTREAAENRKRFMGDGKAKYTPHAVEGF